MAGGTYLVALTLLLLVLPPPTRAAVWRRIGSATDARKWEMDVLPTGVGYAAARDLSSAAFSAFERTADGGRSWRRAAALPRGELPFRFHVLGVGSALLAFSSDTKGTQTSLVWSETTRQWTRQTFEVPAGVKAGSWRVQLSAPVPGANQAFATGVANTTAGRTANYVWRWTGGAAWQVVQTPGRGPSGLVAASRTAAWLSFNDPGDIFRWDGKAWAQIRKGAKGESIQLLKAVPATARNRASAVWALLRSSTGAETLLLCDTARCTAKKAAQTGGRYPGRFLALDAATLNFALVWELEIISGMPHVVQHQHDGSKWTRGAQTAADAYFQGSELRVDPQPLVSAASPTRALATLTYFTRPGSKAPKPLETYVWNGARWAYEEQASLFSSQETGKGASQWALQALNGTALLAKAVGRWRLA